jgi:hypothetical protein
VACTLAAFLFLGGLAAADDDDNGAAQVRRFIDQQVGGIQKLKVPAKDADIPVVRQPDGTVNPRYRTTEEKRYLGKLIGCCKMSQRNCRSTRPS